VQFQCGTCILRVIHGRDARATSLTAPLSKGENVKGLLIALIILGQSCFGAIAVGQGPIILGPGPKSSSKQTMKLLPVGESAPDWQLTDAEGKVHSLSEYRGKVVVLDFWATWCGPCKDVMPRMQKLYEKFKDQGVVVFGVNSWEKKDPVEVMKQKRYSYGLLLKGEEIAEAYKVTSLPAVYMIGADGRIIYCHEGVDDKNLASLIEKYLKAHPST
jgi:thiol-disulfide isomerase/thioredoxin